MKLSPQQLQRLQAANAQPETAQYSGASERFLAEQTPQPPQPPKDLQEKLQKFVYDDSEGKYSLGDLVSDLNSLAACAHKLYTQSHLIHANIEGAMFLSIHEFLKKKYKQHTKQFDTIAEKIRTLDHLLPMCENGLNDLCDQQFEHVTSYEAREMLRTYLTNVEGIALFCKTVYCGAQEVEAPDIEDFLAKMTGELYDTAWYLKATLRN